MKRAKQVGIGLGILLIGALVGSVLLRQILLKQVLEQQLQATGVAVEIETLRWPLFQNHLSLEGVTLDNPPGFSNEPMLQIQTLKITGGWQQFWAKPVVIEGLEIEGLRLTVEQTLSGNNLLTLLQQVQIQPHNTDSEPVIVTIETLTLRQLETQFSLSLLPGLGVQQSISVPDITATDVSAEAAGGLLAAGMVAAVLQALIEAADPALETGQPLTHTPAPKLAPIQ
ncbi:AsmA family protein [Synechococcales cyanobacterium C]|uniref:AsmA family protein n=1 Tax=Petrachloros mirabilis ULC683 TaxID=2781853 RepID=A0A8K2A8W1_9CYAN|nr:AsmA family protein [Petrachloros mirabilis]NCJ07325.1 AsmA family protein [Petrachloros mirabilis ULC683]